MNTKRLNIVLLLLLLPLLACGWFLRPSSARPNYEFLPNMVHSPAYASFSANPNLPGGMTLQAPVPGTIARGQVPLHYAATPEDAIRAGNELVSPYAAKPAAIERGRAVFNTFCLPCHGAGGMGNGPVVARGFPAPPSLLAARALGLKDGQLFHIATFGQKNMPGYASQISSEDRWKAILYVRELRANQAFGLAGLGQAEGLVAWPALAAPAAVPAATPGATTSTGARQP